MSIPTDDVIIFMTEGFPLERQAAQEAVPPQWSIEGLGFTRDNLLWFRNFAAAEPDDEAAANLFAKTSDLRAASCLTGAGYSRR